MALESRMYMLGSNSKSLPKELEHEDRQEESKEEGASSLPISPLQGNQSKSNRGDDICKTGQKTKYEGAYW